MTEATAPACPVCGKPRDPQHRPFCSQRCADVDLARWFRGDYAIPGEPVEDSEDDKGEAG
jgi:endogenous inhibitor of DNA gyrase (YacG/DUF329 family)